jgi:hypothetical protein
MIVDITTYSDAGFTRSFIYETSTFVPIDLTNKKMHMHVRAKAADATVFMALSNDEGDASNIVVTDALNGRFTIKIPYETMTRLPTGVYEQSLIVTDYNGKRDDIWRGTLTHIAGPTRWGST